MVVVELIGTKQWYDARSPEFKARTQAAYDRWSRSNRDAIAAVQREPDYPRRLADSTGALTDRHQALALKLKGREPLALPVTCNDELIEAFDPSPIPEPVFASPQATWGRFIDAVRRSDHEAAIRCLAKNGRSWYLESLIEPGIEPELRAGFLRLATVTFRQADASTAHVVWTPSGETTTIQLRLVPGNWKITTF